MITFSVLCQVLESSPVCSFGRLQTAGISVDGCYYKVMMKTYY